VLEESAKDQSTTNNTYIIAYTDLYTTVLITADFNPEFLLRSEITIISAFPVSTQNK
jgi:hypothetical protein